MDVNDKHGLVLQKVEYEVGLAKLCANSEDWCDSINHLMQAVTEASVSYPDDCPDDIDAVISKCVGYIGGQIEDRVYAKKVERSNSVTIECTECPDTACTIRTRASTPLVPLMRLAKCPGKDEPNRHEWRVKP